MTIKSVLITALLLLGILSVPLYAQDYYVCNNGSDKSSGKSPLEPWATFDYAMSRFNKLKAGDSILLCRNGNFTSSYPKLFNPGCKRKLPCTIGDYVPLKPPANKRGNKALPVINGANGGIRFEDSGNADHDEGYVIKNLYFKGAGKGRGIFIFNDVDFLVVDGVTIEGFGLGLHSAQANKPNVGSDQVNENLTIKNSNIINNSSQGWMGGCNNCLIDNNKFINNGFSKSTHNHNIYFSGRDNSDIVISNNTLYKSAIVNNKCSGVSLVVHGTVKDLTISGNTVYEDLAAVNQTCWGISVDPGYAAQESFTNVSIINNTVNNVGNVGIGCASCVGLQIKGNKISHAQDFAFTAIKVPVREEDKVKSDQITITGNNFNLQETNKKKKTRVQAPKTGKIKIGTDETGVLR